MVYYMHLCSPSYLVGLTKVSFSTSTKSIQSFEQVKKGVFSLFARALWPFPGLEVLSWKSFSSHVVGHVDRVKLVGQEPVSQMHPLLLAPRVDGDGARIGDDNDSDDQVTVLQNRVRDQGHQVQGFILGTVEFGDDHKEIRPSKNGAERNK